MASLQKKGNSWYCQFFWKNRRFTYSVGKVTLNQAEAKATRTEEIISLLERGLMKIPDHCDVLAFVKYDGQPPIAEESQKFSNQTLLNELFQDYLKAHDAALEPKTLYTIRIHLKHIAKTMGLKFDLKKLELPDLQKHVTRRCTKVSPTTAAKEIATLRTLWNWGVRMKLLEGPCPVKGLIYPKHDEKPPFQTRVEIIRQLEGLSDKQQKCLWDCLYLDIEEIESFLKEVKKHAKHDWIYPLVATAAYAGLRRSELIRLRISDIDFQALTISVRELKRVKGKRTTRRVQIPSVLESILQEWMKSHPGGDRLFAQSQEVPHSKKRNKTTGLKTKTTLQKTRHDENQQIRLSVSQVISPLTEHEVSDHFRRTINRSEWAVMPGLHCLRHSFISACASKGLDQRIIDEWVGHQTDEQRRRYRHLYPSVQKAAINSVFGNSG